MLRMKGPRHHLRILPAAPAPARRVYLERLLHPTSRHATTFTAKSAPAQRAGPTSGDDAPGKDAK